MEAVAKVERLSRLRRSVIASGAGIAWLACFSCAAMAQVDKKEVVSLSQQLVQHFLGPIGTGILVGAAVLALILCFAGQSRFGMTLLALAIVGFGLRFMMTQQPSREKKAPQAPAQPAAVPTKPPSQAVARRPGNGMDIFVGGAAEVKALSAGSVVAIGNSEANGGQVAVKQPDGLVIFYAQLGSLQVQKGQMVQRGTPLGRVRDTFGLEGGRPHLHLEARGVNNAPVELTRFVPGLQFDGTGKVLNPNILLPVPVSVVGNAPVAAPADEPEEGMVSF